jgi:hypothetical protein
MNVLTVWAYFAGMFVGVLVGINLIHHGWINLK